MGDTEGSCSLKMMCPNPGGFDEELYSNGSRVGLLKRLVCVQGCVYVLSCSYRLSWLFADFLMSDSLQPLGCHPPGSFAHGDAPGQNIGESCMHSSRGSSQPRNGTQVSRTAGGFFTIWVTREAHEYWSG